MLIEAFGLSRTQASRYGRFEEYLLEEEIKSQRDLDNEGLMRRFCNESRY